jgi:hypothetical protein
MNSYMVTVGKLFLRNTTGGNIFYYTRGLIFHKLNTLKVNRTPSNCHWLCQVCVPSPHRTPSNCHWLCQVCVPSPHRRTWPITLLGKSTMGIRSQGRKRAKIGLNQSLIYIYPSSPTLISVIFICPSSTR